MPMPAIDLVAARMVKVIQKLLGETSGGEAYAAGCAKPYWIDINRQITLSKNSEFVQLANSPVLLAAAQEYLKDTPVISAVILMQTIGSVSNIASPQASQMWHVDNDDTKMFKFFVYLTDVATTEEGPFTLVPATESKKVWRSLLVRLKLRTRIPDKDFFGGLGEGGNVIEMMGPRHSWFVVDTHRCYHFGSRTTTTRLALFITYISPVSLVPSAIDLSTSVAADGNL